jgi:hypothetical protein
MERDEALDNIAEIGLAWGVRRKRMIGVPTFEKLLQKRQAAREAGGGEGRAKQRRVIGGT